MKDNRSTIIKTFIALAAIVIIFSSLSKIFLGGSETLEEYAQNNPDANTPKVTSTPTPEATQEDVKATPSPAPVPSPTPEPPLSPEVLIMQQFYYAPLTEEQKDYITGCSYPEGEEVLEISYEDLSYVHILHYNFEGEVVDGELICNNAIAEDLVSIFYELYRNEYQLERVALIENYNGDDELSMADNNTSCFNYRVVAGTKKLSQHAYGLAVDINPFYNPYVTYPNGGINIAPLGSEAYADRDADFPYKIDENDLCYKLFKEHGFTWGGDWNSSKDYQHFQKVIQ